MFGAMDISTSALTSLRTRMDVISSNIANANTTRDAAGNSIPYRRHEALLAAGAVGSQDGTGVKVAGIVEDPSPFREVHMPGHPDAGPDGIVRFPNVDLQQEMVSAIVAMRAYEANIAAFEVSKQMMNQALRLIA